jgi:NADH-quinone oxidoreductase subunit G
VVPPGEAKEDWRIIRAAGAALGVKLPFDTLEDVRAAMVAANPVFGLVDGRIVGGARDIAGPAAGGVLADAPFKANLTDYWLADPISRASETMAECSRIYNAAPVAQAAE